MGAKPVAIRVGSTVSSTTRSASGVVQTAETVSSVAYADIATVGPACSIVCGDSGLVIVTLTAQLVSPASNAIFMSFAISGGSTVAASDNNAVINASSNVGAGGTFPVPGLTPGVTYTFTAKYRVSGGSGPASHRFITASTN